MAFIILKDRPLRFGKTRSEQEKNLRKEGMQSLTEEQLDKCKYLEKKTGIKKSFFGQDELGQVR